MRYSTKGKDPSEMGKGGAGNQPEPGRYHVVVQDVDDSYEKNDTCIIVDLQVLAGTVPGQEEKKTKEFLYLPATNTPDWAVDRVSRFLWACGLLGEDEERDIQLQEAVACHLVVELGKDSYKDKHGKEKETVRLDWNAGGLWPIGHPDVQDVPLNQDAAKYRKQRGAAAPAQEAAATSGQQAPAVSGGGDIFGDL